MYVYIYWICIYIYIYIYWIYIYTLNISICIYIYTLNIYIYIYTLYIYTLNIYIYIKYIYIHWIYIIIYIYIQWIYIYSEIQWIWMGRIRPLADADGNRPHWPGQDIKSRLLQNRSTSLGETQSLWPKWKWLKIGPKSHWHPLAMICYDHVPLIFSPWK